MRRSSHLVVLLVLWTGVVSADGFFRSSEWGVELTVPRGWELSEQRSYPGIIARAFEHKGGGHLLLAAERVGADENVRSYAERNQKVLLKAGYHITGVATREGGAVVMDSATPDRKRLLRQAYFVVGRAAYVLTIAVKAEAARTGRPFEAFDEALRTLTLAPPPEPAAASQPASQPAESPKP